MNAPKVCYVLGCICFVFAAFAFHPFGDFEFGWMGAALVALGLSL
jgi:hypothetical protein